MLRDKNRIRERSDLADEMNRLVRSTVRDYKREFGCKVQRVDSLDVNGSTHEHGTHMPPDGLNARIQRAAPGGSVIAQSSENSVSSIDHYNVHGRIAPSNVHLFIADGGATAHLRVNGYPQMHVRILHPKEYFFWAAKMSLVRRWVQDFCYANGVRMQYGHPTDVFTSPAPEEDGILFVEQRDLCFSADVRWVHDGALAIPSSACFMKDLCILVLNAFEMLGIPIRHDSVWRPHMGFMSVHVDTGVEKADGLRLLTEAFNRCFDSRIPVFHLDDGENAAACRPLSDEIPNFFLAAPQGTWLAKQQLADHVTPRTCREGAALDFLNWTESVDW